MLTTKKCTMCETTKSTTEFYRHSTTKDNLTTRCKECDGIKITERSRTPKGIATLIYNNQRKRSKKRGHPMPSYTNSELHKWITSQDNFDSLYLNWCASDYDTWMKPSVDRINDYKPYTLDNIQLVTWRENNNRIHQDKKNGVNNKNSKGVMQYTLDDELVKEHYSISQAGRDTGINKSNITKCCKLSCETAGGYRWKYSNRTLRR